MVFSPPRAARPVRSLQPIAASLYRALSQPHLRKSSIILMVAAGFSSMTQWPELGTMAVCTLLAAARLTRPIIGPNDFSPPIARPGLLDIPLAGNPLLCAAASTE